MNAPRRKPARTPRPALRTPAPHRAHRPAARRTGRPPADRSRTALGRYGETLAVRRLTASGHTILDRNWRSGPAGEIDIVARDGDTIIVVEVKTRRSGAYQHPMEAITATKAQRLRTLAEHWLHAHPDAHAASVRIDLVGVVLPHRGAPLVEHVRGVA
ncbi:YraN family protein [Streptomyces sp. NPDC050560]|uniref:YraN family protein n=1 Tax=Streptomyces sp. NPDC050560 TaxID=3365630 RepID=UPI003799F775